MSFDEEQLDEHSECRHEIESLRAQLAEVTRERDKQQELSDWYQDHSNILARVGQERDKLKQQLLATQAKLAQSELHAARLVEALSKIPECAWWEDARQIVSVALSTPTNLDALNEDRARECERLANVAGDEPEHVKALFSEWLREEAAAHRAKKEGGHGAG